MAWVTNSTVLWVCVEDPQQFLLHDDLGLCIERGERLVHQQDRPLHDQRARQRHALAHAAGQLARQVALEAAQPDRSDQPPRALDSVRLGDAAHLQPEGDVVDDAAPGKQVEVLPDHHRVGAERAADRPAWPDRWMRMVPRVAGSRPPTIWISVLLPHPLGPSRQENRPERKRWVKRSSATTWVRLLAPDLRHVVDHNIHLRPTAFPARPTGQLLRQSGADPRGLAINCSLTSRPGETAIISTPWRASPVLPDCSARTVRNPFEHVRREQRKHFTPSIIATVLCRRLGPAMLGGVPRIRPHRGSRLRPRPTA